MSEYLYLVTSLVEKFYFLLVFYFYQKYNYILLDNSLLSLRESTTIPVRSYIIWPKTLIFVGDYT